MGHALRAIAALVIVASLLLAPAVARAQDQTLPLIWDLTRKVLIDPTTYAPAAISYEAISRDWKTSQVLFAHGWVEQNPRFTISGRPNDAPLSYGAGQRVIRRETLSILQHSVLNNLAVGVGERLLIARYPSRKKLIRVVSWVERVGFASFVTYRNSADHFRQASTNLRIAREHAYIPR